MQGAQSNTLDDGMHRQAANATGKLMPFPDGTPQEVLRLSGTRWRSDVAWSPDSRFIYYTDQAAGARDWHLWRVPADGGTARDLGALPASYEQISVHPDGPRITFSSSTLDPEPSQLWVMENFLPAAKR